MPDDLSAALELRVAAEGAVALDGSTAELKVNLSDMTGLELPATEVVFLGGRAWVRSG